ncbi:Alcohol dehydrogenase-like 7, partial [Cucurbita argyrosperma subsp. argyrosperma]
MNRRPPLTQSQDDAVTSPSFQISLMDESSAATGVQSIRCRAAVCRKPGEPLVIEEIIVAPPRAREVRIRITCTSLCLSDVTFWKLKDPPGIVPRILGHEAIGVVESVGKDVNEVKEGDTVIPIFMADCGECADCLSVKSNLCSKLPFKIAPGMPRCGTSRFTDINGGVIHHFLSVSSFTEYTVVDIANVAEGARLCGASRIIGIDINPDKFEAGKSLGDKHVSQVINEMTDGGADYCFECVGMASLVHEAFACCRKVLQSFSVYIFFLHLDYTFSMGWGKTIVVGVDKPDATLSFSSYDSIMGSLYGGLKPKSDIPTLLKWYTDKKLELDKFVTYEVGFEDINQAFNLLMEGKCLRSAVCRKPGEPLVIEEISVAPPMAREVRIRIICTSLCHTDISVWKLKEGDTVIPTFMADCGDCEDCFSTNSNLCSKFPFSMSSVMPRHGTSRFTDLNGEVIHHFLYVSSFSEYTVVDVAYVIKVAEGARLCGASRIIGIDINQDKFEVAKKFGVTELLNSGRLEDKSVSQ